MIEWVERAARVLKQAMAEVDAEAVQEIARPCRAISGAVGDIGTALLSLQQQAKRG